MSSGKRLVTFYIKSYLFGLEINYVKEINKYFNFTKVPQSGDDIIGLVNLRGQIVTLVDISLILGFEKAEIDKDSCNIVLKNDILRYSFVVDKIGDIIDIDESSIHQIPANFNKKNSSLTVEFIKKIVKLDTNIVMLLNLEEILKLYYE